MTLQAGADHPSGTQQITQQGATELEAIAAHGVGKEAGEGKLWCLVTAADASST
jgi:hypothetical protein